MIFFKKTLFCFFILYICFRILYKCIVVMTKFYLSFFEI
jgi:hypothetical protein